MEYPAVPLSMPFSSSTDNIALGIQGQALMSNGAVDAAPSFQWPLANNVIEFSITGVNFSASAVTNVYTVPAGKTYNLYAWSLDISSLSATTNSGVLSASVGSTAPSYNDLSLIGVPLSSFSTYSSVVTYPGSASITPVVNHSLTAGQILNFNCRGTTQTTGAFTGNVHFIGTLQSN